MFNIGVVLFISALNIIGSTLQAATGFGDAILMHIIWEAAIKLPFATAALHSTPLGTNDVTVVTVMTYFRVLAVNPTIIYLNRHEKFNWRIFWIMTSTQSVFGIVGEFMLLNMEIYLLKIVFASFVMIVAVLFSIIKLRAFKLKKEHKKADHYFDANGMPSPLLQASIGVAGCIGGIAGSLFGVAGPPFMLCILYFNLPAPLCRRTFIATFLVAGIIRFVAAAYSGIVTVDMLPYAGLIITTGLLGLYTGQKCARKMSNIMFTSLILSFLLLASIAMLPWPPTVLISSFVAVCIGLVVIHFKTKDIVDEPASPAPPAVKTICTTLGSPDDAASPTAGSPTASNLVQQLEDYRSYDDLVELLPLPLPSDEELAQIEARLKKRSAAATAVIMPDNAIKS